MLLMSGAGAVFAAENGDANKEKTAVPITQTVNSIAKFDLEKRVPKPEPVKPIPFPEPIKPTPVKSKLVKPTPQPYPVKPLDVTKK